MKIKTIGMSRSNSLSTMASLFLQLEVYRLGFHYPAIPLNRLRAYCLMRLRKYKTATRSDNRIRIASASPALNTARPLASRACPPRRRGSGASTSIAQGSASIAPGSAGPRPLSGSAGIAFQAMRLSHETAEMHFGGGLASGGAKRISSASAGTGAVSGGYFTEVRRGVVLYV